MPSSPVRRQNRTFDGATNENVHLIQSGIRCDEKAPIHRPIKHAGPTKFSSDASGKTAQEKDKPKIRASNASLVASVLVLLNLSTVLVIWCSLATTTSWENESVKEQRPPRILIQLFDKWSSKKMSFGSSKVSPPRIAKDLILRHFYEPNDFFNEEQGTYVPYWWRIEESDRNTKEILDDNRWGPCFPPRNETEVLEYALRPKSVQVESYIGNESEIPKYQRPKECEERNSAQSSSLDSMCLPGYLIVGAGKCGTSSLYHYLIAHPRVAPARQKQIGYYKVSYEASVSTYLPLLPVEVFHF
jgi:hypothetical protein